MRMDMMLKLIVTLFLLVALTGSALFADSKPKWSIYLDPSAADIESTISPQNATKEEPVFLAKQVKSLLEDKGFLVYTAKADAPPEARLLQARQLNADLYISLRKSDEKKSCVRLYYPIRKYENYSVTEQNRSQMKGRDIGEIFSSLKNEYITKESARMAGVLSQHLEVKKVPQCGPAKTEEDYILENTFCPTAIIDMGTSTRNAVAGVIAESIQEYFATSTRQPGGGSKALQPGNFPGPPPDKR